MVDTISLPGRQARIVSRCDIAVVGGGPAGTAAAIAAARRGASVTLLERQAYLGGMASGGMVLVLDDMVDGQTITVRGIVEEYVDRLDRLGLAVYPPESERGLDQEWWNKWARWGTFDFYKQGRIKPIVYAVAFDPDGWKRVSNDLIREAGIELRLHSWFSTPLVENGKITGVVCETKAGPQVILAETVIDASGDADVVTALGEEHSTGQYLVTTVFRLGGVDTTTAEAFDVEQPGESRRINDEIRSVLGGAWKMWWLRTPLPGVVWCNCPHMTGFDGTSVEDLTAADIEGRRRIALAVEHARQNLPGFENCYVIDVAPQLGVRQTRQLQGEYVVTKEDILSGRRFEDSVARGRDYFTPYRSMVPKNVDGLLVAGRHYSAEPAAQKISREIPPCMAMGEAAGTAAAIALDSGVKVRDVDLPTLQWQLIAQGADPGVTLDDLAVRR